MNANTKKKLENLDESMNSSILTRILMLVMVVGFFLTWKFVKGTLTIEDFYKSNSIMGDYNIHYIIKCFYELKDYIITFSVILIVVYFLNKSNREWEEKNLKIQQDEENDDEIEDESNTHDSNDKIDHQTQSYSTKVSSGKKKRLSMVPENENEDENEDEDEYKDKQD